MPRNVSPGMSSRYFSKCPLLSRIQCQATDVVTAPVQTDLHLADPFRPGRCICLRGGKETNEGTGQKCFKSHKNKKFHDRRHALKHVLLS